MRTHGLPLAGAAGSEGGAPRWIDDGPARGATSRPGGPHRGAGKSRPARAQGPVREVAPWDCEAEIIPGLSNVAEDEIAARLGGRVTYAPAARPDVLRLHYRGDLAALLELQSVVEIFLVRAFPVPRPRGLLGNEQFGALLALIAAVRALFPAGAFRTLRLSAAGEDTPVMRRLRDDLAARTGLRAVAEEGDLLVRVRREPGGPGWEVLVRLGPRPLSARAWRVCNRPGALNAVVAYGMIALGGPAPGDRVLNLACGSGTLLIERLRAAPAALAAGVDTDPAALACAAANLAAADLAGAARLVRADAGRLPWPDGAFDLLTADLPFGRLVGSHVDNTRLYPALLAEATRVAAPHARLVLITHEVHLMERLLAEPALAAAWIAVDTRRVTLPFKTGGLNPRIYLLQRRGAGA